MHTASARCEITAARRKNPCPDAVRLVRCKTFVEFYPLYSAEHSSATCGQLHFSGSTLALVCLFCLVFTGNVWWFALAIVRGYAFAWASHDFFQHKHPATFTRPIYSLMGDVVAMAERTSGGLTSSAWSHRIAHATMYRLGFFVASQPHAQCPHSKTLIIR